MASLSAQAFGALTLSMRPRRMFWNCLWFAVVIVSLSCLKRVENARKLPRGPSAGLARAGPEASGHSSQVRPSPEWSPPVQVGRHGAARGPSILAPQRVGTMCFPKPHPHSGRQDSCRQGMAGGQTCQEEAAAPSHEQGRLGSRDPTPLRTPRADVGHMSRDVGTGADAWPPSTAL